MIEARIDSREIDSFLNTLDDESVRHDIIFEAMHEGALLLRENARNYFKSAYGSVANHVGRWYDFPMYEGIELIEENKNDLVTGVHILRDHRLRWLEKGTNSRTTGEIQGYSLDRTKRYRTGGHDTGQIIGKFFFKNAVQASESEVQEAMFRSLDESIKRLES